MTGIVVIPTDNERENLKGVLDAIWRHVDWLHVLIVDDNSPDGTGQLAEELRRERPEQLFVMHRQGKQGLGTAYREAFKKLVHQDYDVILQMDADLSHDPSYLPSLIRAAERHDVVVGSRYVQGINVVNWDFRRLVLSKLATAYVNLVTGLPLTDTTGGFKCWRRTALRSLSLDRLFATGYLFQIETNYRAHCLGLDRGEVPIIFYERRLGQSKISLRIIMEAAFGVLTLPLRVPRLKSKTVAVEP